ncbi:hypothetical protein BGZ65_012286 [Modicella reniformis]|uniref:DNA 3'-5' helicase n=1 Tax=Modicella reniformis TaxID=1440133 RepID=A0A9P6MCS3_9FUNG|nr:hypothetical protein BGZ65_012286 [Modicella reniformis]
MDVINFLHFKDVSIVNVGNDRLNIKYSVVEMKEAASSFRDLAFLQDMVKTIVYIDNRKDVDSVAKYVGSLIGNKQVAAYHSIKSEELKKLRIEEFKNNEKRVLISTEAAGMGCDIRDVKRVVQYGYPKTLSMLIQRLGRAARDPTLSGTSIFLVPPRPGSDVPQELRGYVETTGCRRRYLNTYFENVHQDVAV